MASLSHACRCIQFGRICRSALPLLPEGSKESDRIEYQHLQCDSYVCYQQFQPRNSRIPTNDSLLGLFFLPFCECLGTFSDFPVRPGFFNIFITFS
jgi:hypothetical protein